MEKEDKKLLLKDLCARLPYGVIVDYAHNAFSVHNGHYVEHGSKCILTCHLLGVFKSPRQNEKGEYIKPYLRPMSSMTEEEKKRYDDILTKMYYHEKSTLGDISDYLNSIHVDYRGLIEKGLAIKVTKENNPYE